MRSTPTANSKRPIATGGRPLSASSRPGALPDPRIEFKALFNPLNSSFFDTVLDSVSVGFSQEIPRKAKRKARAEQSLALAQAEGSRFRQAKYSLQTKVTRVYAGLALNARLTELNAETLRLFRETYDITLRRYNTMAEGNLADLRKIEAEIQKTESETRALGIERDRLTGEMNGLLNRPAGSAYGKAELRRFRASTDSEAEMFARAVRNNPELAAQRKEIAARGAAQVLAELEKKPDFEVNGELGYALSGSVTPTLGFSTTLPINRARIRAGIAEALAMRQASEAKYRAAESDALARLVMALNAIRDTRRILDDYQNHIIPTTKEALDTQLSTYGSGGGDFLDILDTERLLIDYRKLVLQAEADRLRFYAEVQDVLGEDLLLLNDAPAAGGPKRD